MKFKSTDEVRGRSRHVMSKFELPSREFRNGAACPVMLGLAYEWFESESELFYKIGSVNSASRSCYIKLIKLGLKSRNCGRV